MTFPSPPVFIGSVVFAVALTAAGAVLLHVMFARARAKYEMPAADKAVWRAADSLAQVGALTARWLTGDLSGQPGYWGPVDVDEQDAPGMTGVLIDCNRSSFLTFGSQAAYNGTGDDGAHWQQLAAVEGLINADDLTRLRGICAGTGITVDASGEGRAVTFRNRRAFTTFGARRTDLADDWTGYGICSPAAVAELQQACPVVVFDPEPGRDDRLWPTLARFAQHDAGSAQVSRTVKS
jgi:hypothetical protein